VTYWTTALPDWERRVIAGESLCPVGAIYPESADDALDVFNNLTLVDAPNGPEMLGSLCRPWVTDIVRAIFGAFDPETKRRSISQFFFCVSKKNGKSSIAAGVMLTALVVNHRPSAEFLILAPTKEGAENAYKPIRDMINTDEDLKSRFAIQEHTKTITDRLNQSILKIVAADSATVTGKKATGVFIDELHEFGKSSKAMHMLTEATGGLASRPEGFVVYCTTQSSDPPAGVFSDKLSYARKVRDGKIKDSRFLPIIYEFPDEWLRQKKHLDLANAWVTNPNWGLSVDEEVIRQKYQEAEEAGEHAVRDFMAKHCNVQVNLALAGDRWAGADFWEQCKDAKPVTLDRILAECEVVDIGIDGGGLDDLLGLAVIGRVKGQQNWMLWTHAWAHPSVMKRHKQEASRFNDFKNDGDLTIVDRIGQDVEGVAEICAKVETSGLLDKIGVDPHGLGGIIEALHGADIPPEKIIGISQGWRMTGAIKTAERKLAEKAMIHGGQSLMTWCVSNAKVEPRGNAVIITKAGSGSGKIDCLMAALDAVSLISLNPESAGGGYQMLVLG
jgi:phage terminase large subunit-like protein